MGGAIAPIFSIASTLLGSKPEAPAPQVIHQPAPEPKPMEAPVQAPAGPPVAADEVPIQASTKTTGASRRRAASQRRTILSDNSNKESILGN